MGKPERVLIKNGINPYDLTPRPPHDWIVKTCKKCHEKSTKREAFGTEKVLYEEKFPGNPVDRELFKLARLVWEDGSFFWEKYVAYDDDEQLEPDWQLCFEKPDFVGEEPHWIQDRSDQYTMVCRWIDKTVEAAVFQGKVSDDELEWAVKSGTVKWKEVDRLIIT